jgi:hypothetical protein
MRKVFLPTMLVALVLLAPPAVAADKTISEEYRQDIRKLLILTGSDRMAMQLLANMFASFREALPQVPDEFWTEAMKEFKAEEMIALVVPIYARHLSHDDVKGLIQFYESPLGRKVIQVLPAITQESYTAGELWGRNIGEKVRQKLIDKGYIKT